MTPHERNLSLAIDALAMLEESMQRDNDPPAIHYWYQLATDAKKLVEEAAMPKLTFIGRIANRLKVAA